MAKNQKTVWFCKECGNDSPKWEGRCPACGAWNSMVEERVSKNSSKQKSMLSPLLKTAPQSINEIKINEETRITMPSKELNRVLGGGLVAGSMVLVGGEPGIGKSTLVLQNTLSIRTKKVLYVSGEESGTQIKMRADRLGRGSENVYVVTETSLENIFEHIHNLNPGLIIIDSIQTIACDDVESASGSVSQIRECASRLLAYAKSTSTPIITIGHVTKDGNLAGPKVLEHIVDAVLQFEGDTKNNLRILRATKNRFGNTNETGIYEMTGKGLREVTEATDLLISSNRQNLSGISLGVTIEGQRPYIIEVQALVSTAAYGVAQRTVTGFDPKRLNMLLAVLEKRAGFRLAAKDVFLNIAGGIKVSDTALDLAIVTAILSSNSDAVVPVSLIAVGEVTLSGQIRAVSRIEQRINEAQRLGMTHIVIPYENINSINISDFKIKIIPVKTIEETIRAIWNNH